MRAISRLWIAVTFCSLVSVTNKAIASSKHSDVESFAHYTFITLDVHEARYCLARYNREVEKSKELLAKNGSMTEFFYAQRKLRRAYWHLNADRVIYDQKFIDLWESFDIGLIDHNTAVAITIKIMNDGYDNRNEKMKRCN